MRVSFAVISALLAASGVVNAAPAVNVDTIRAIANALYDSVEDFSERLWPQPLAEERQTVVDTPLYVVDDVDADDIETSTLPSAAEQAQYLKWHNAARSRHGAVPLTWSNAAAQAAQNWANRCVFQHGGGRAGGFGENLAAGTGNYPISDAITDWVKEESEYNPRNPKASHYTQVVWKSTRQLGCAKAVCNNIFPGSAATYYVCEYFPAGNVIGRFAQNVS
ncbi:hypothetical protein FRC02_002563 [Tulasnella sp. 418]|nr:hypothetical protein FRC02_002563 [Tulasnella sp. 418]